MPEYGVVEQANEAHAKKVDFLSTEIRHLLSLHHIRNSSLDKIQALKHLQTHLYYT